MSVWDRYETRLNVLGRTKRDRTLNLKRRWINQKLPESLSYHTVMVDGEEQQIAVLRNRESASLKKIYSLPGETLPHGKVIDFSDAKWLVTEVDADDEVYTSGAMERCNYLLKWLNEKGEIVERWCIVVDGTKYLIGEKTKEVMTIGDARIAVTLGKDEETSKLNRGKRFLIDDLDSLDVLAYQITKPNKLFNIYDNKGVFRFILNEVNLTDEDNVELRIADYFNWTPPRDLPNQHKDKDIPLDEVIEEAENTPEPDDNKGVWL